MGPADSTRVRPRAGIGRIRAQNLSLACLAGCLALASRCPATAAEVRPGGALDLTLTGFVRFLAHGGQLDDARQDDSYSRSLDFSNDTELHLLARGRDEATGLEYGATIEFDADTDQTLNTIETWIFVRGGWGEVRLGDVDGIAEESSVGAQEVAAGTGGIDGDVVDEIAVPVVFITNTNTATKIRYYTPSFDGLSLGLSLHADPGGGRRRRAQRPVHRPQGRRLRHGGPERGRGWAWSGTARSARSRSSRPWSAFGAA